MRIVLDVTATAGGRIEGTASWVNGGQPIGQPIPFTGWLDLMRLFEDANSGHVEKAVNHQHRGDNNCRAEDLPGSADGP
jgi:hypothetical protein